MICSSIGVLFFFFLFRMDSNNQQNVMGNYPPRYFHVNPTSLNWQWNYVVPGPPAVRGHYVHVNPAFFQPNVPPPPELPNRKRIIVNPKFFPHVQPEKNIGIPSNYQEVYRAERIVLVQKDEVPYMDRQAVQEKVKANKQPISTLDIHNSEQIAQQQHTKPSPIRHLADRRKLTKFNFTTNPVRSKYKWRKMESPLKTIAIKHAYKLVRKCVVKSPKLVNRFTQRGQHYAFKTLTPPKLTSTPIEKHSPANSRFKLDNRVLKTKKRTSKIASPRASLPKILQSKYRLIRNKCWKSNSLTLGKFGLIVNRSVINRSIASRSVVNRNFTNFKSPLCTPLAHHSSRLQRLAVISKSNKTVKKTKTSKKKKQKRYYDEETKAKPDEEVLDDVDVEIVEKPSGPKMRTPIGVLPSFITL